MKFALNAVGALLVPMFVTAVALSSPMTAQAATAAAAKASAPAPGVLERTEQATKKAAHATVQAISNTGKAIDAKVPRTKAYKKKHPKDVPGSGAN
jgi:hypothetical protein